MQRLIPTPRPMLGNRWQALQAEFQVLATELLALRALAA